MRRAARSAAVALVLGCAQAPDERPGPRADATIDAPLDASLDDPFAEPCPAGSFRLPGGTCSPPWACPAGWSPIADVGGCAAPECDNGVPTADGACQAVGLPGCGAPAGPPNAVSVRPGDDLSAALATGRPVALGAGRHQVDELELPAGARVIGACPAQTRIEGGLVAREGEVRLEHLTLADDAAALQLDGGTLLLDGVVVRGPALVTGGQLIGDRVVAAAGVWSIEEPAELTCDRCRFDNAPIQAAGRVHLRESAARDGEPAVLRFLGEATLEALQVSGGTVGVSIGADARVRADRLRVAHAWTGLVASGGKLTLIDGYFAALGARGLALQDGAQIHLERVAIDGVSDALEDTPHGILIGLSAQVTSRHLYLARVPGIGLRVGEAEAPSMFEALVIRDIAPWAAADHLGVGLSIDPGGRVFVDAAVIERPAGPTLGVSAREAELALTDVTIQGMDGAGIVAHGSVLGFDRVVVRATGEAPVGAGYGVWAAASRVVGVGLRLIDNASAGLVLLDSAADLRGGAVQGHSVGIVLSGASRLDERGVDYRDNGRDHQTCAAACVPAPGPAD